MKTPTHLLLGHLLARSLPGSGPKKFTYVMWGAVLPDVPLLIVGLFSWLQTICEYVGLSFVARMDAFYFDNALFISLHHMLHSPTSLVLLFSCWFVLHRLDRTDNRAFWFLCGAASHSIVDIFTHAEDGVLVLWPLNWNYRFNSGLDQWNMQGAGFWLAAIEVTFVAGYGGAFLWKTVKPSLRPNVFPKSVVHLVRWTTNLSLTSGSNAPGPSLFPWTGSRLRLALIGWCRSKCWCNARSQSLQQ